MVYHVLILMSVILIMAAVVKCVLIKLDLTIVSVTVDILLTMMIMDAQVIKSFKFVYPQAYSLDINECTNDNGNCEHNCINNNGSYSCSCYNGYSLDVNGRNCTGT